MVEFILLTFQKVNGGLTISLPPGKFIRPKPLYAIHLPVNL